MDLNITLTTTTTSTAIVNNNQENNQLLLNAIKNKFSASTANEAAAFSPPKFNIPLLKIPGGGVGLSNNQISNNDKNTNQLSSNTTTTTSQLNTFLLKQLQEKNTNNATAANGFMLPQLQISNNIKPDTISLTSNVSSLTTSLNQLKVQDPLPEKQKTSAIDLSSALASKLQTHQGTPPTRDFIKPGNANEKDIDFEIPFIDCDRWDNSHKSALILPTSNEYCITDISQLLLQHFFVDEPSPIGQFLSCDEEKYLKPLPLKYLKAEYHQQKVKHYIKPFDFETKSPDDLVLEALNKYQRRHYN